MKFNRKNINLILYSTHLSAYQFFEQLEEEKKHKIEKNYLEYIKNKPFEEYADDIIFKEIISNNTKENLSEKYINKIINNIFKGELGKI